MKIKFFEKIGYTGYYLFEKCINEKLQDDVFSLYIISFE